MKLQLRELPAIHEIKKNVEFKKFFLISQDEELLLDILREEVNNLRKQILLGNTPVTTPSKESFTKYILKKIEGRIRKYCMSKLSRVINATGVVLHTNLGRSRLSNKSIQHITEVASNYSNLEYNIAEGNRGSRNEILEELIVRVTESEAAIVVNNNAAAVFLILRAFAKNKEVIVSRGQLVEIGGSFRVSTIMQESDAKLVEVGTTNKTHLYDYDIAITKETAMIMKVHSSNFKVIGFTESVSSKNLALLCKKYADIIFYEDLGSGSIFDFKKHNIGEESVVKEVLLNGADLVSFSGDKLLGGPQAGIIVGKKVLIDKLKRHPLARVLRVDKMTLAGLEQTFAAYVNNDGSIYDLPTIRDIMRSPKDILSQAELFVKNLQDSTSIYSLQILKGKSKIGGGTMPGVELSTYVVAIKHNKYSARNLALELRTGYPAILTRIRDDMIIVDLRTITPEEMPELINRFVKIDNN